MPSRPSPPRPRPARSPDLSPRQLQVLHSYQRTHNIAATARELRISRGTARVHLADCARRGHAPRFDLAPDVPGWSVGRTTIQVGADGTIERQWPRMAPDAVSMEAVVSALEDRVAGKAPPLADPPRRRSADLMLEWPIPDHHMGMLAWGRETGADYDIPIATQLLTAGARLLLRHVGAMQKALLVVLGDFYHADLRTAQTERGGHVLDVDGRAPKRVDAGIGALCACIEQAAACAAEVEVIVIQGNHDPMSAVWLARVLAAYYRKARRIAIRTDPAPQQVVQWGTVGLLYAHGDTTPMQKLARLFPAKWPRLWADTTHRRVRIGHWHTKVVEEYPGVTAETLPSLVAPDAYAANGGYLSERLLTGIVWSATHGHRARYEFGAAEIQAAA